MTHDSTNLNLAHHAETDEAHEAASRVDERPADERTDELLTTMAPRRAVLLAILAQCREAQAVAAVNAHVDELQKHNFSVYSAANLCTLLERAGALERVTADGEPAEQVDLEPQTVVVDGVEYLEAREPLERLRELLEQDAAYEDIYARILTLCAAEGGATTSSINDAVDHDPLVQQPRLYGPRFVDRLEKCGALIWQSTWVTTEVGRAALAWLAPATADEQE